MLKWLLHKFDIDVHDLIIFCDSASVSSGQDIDCCLLFFFIFFLILLSDIHIDVY